MRTLRTVIELRTAVRAARRQDPGARVGLVPTMGALHAGHASLIDAAARTCNVVAVTVFVNPLQFSPNEDLAEYPRPFANDVTLSEAHGAHYVFHPSVEEMYGQSGAAVLTTVHVAGITDTLEGAARPGHFDGVSTVVAKLLNAAGPCRAFFGEKDYQQLQVVRQLVHDLSFPIEIVGCPIVRESDGLAMSSRNAYLSAEDRRRASALSRELFAARDRASGRAKDPRSLEEETRRALIGSGLDVDYVEVVDSLSMERAERLGPGLALAAAVRLGKTRLIDNVLLPADEIPRPPER